MSEQQLKQCSACAQKHTPPFGRYCRLQAHQLTDELHGLPGPETDSEVHAGAEGGAPPDQPADMPTDLPPARTSQEYIKRLEDTINRLEEELEAQRHLALVDKLENKVASLKIQVQGGARNQDGRTQGGHSQPASTPATVGGVWPGRQEKESVFAAAYASEHQADFEPDSTGRVGSSKFRPEYHLVPRKAYYRLTYRELNYGCIGVLNLLIESGMPFAGYLSHVRFIAAKAAQQVFTTEALVSYERAVTTKVLRGSIPDWMASDAESVSLYLGVEGTFALRNAMANPRIPRSSKSSWDDWPDTVCWLYNYRQCESAKCRRRHVCGFCRSKDHKAKDCTLPKSSSASVHNKADYPEVRKNSE